MPLINYNSPDYQQMIQKVMSRPLVNQGAARRSVQQKFVGDRMRSSLALDDVMLRRKAMENELALGERRLGINEQAQNARYAAAIGRHQLARDQFGRNRSDLNRQMLFGLAPMVYSVYEGNRRAKQMQAFTDKQNQFMADWYRRNSL
jgi:hypothetical protein